MCIHKLNDYSPFLIVPFIKDHLNPTGYDLTLGSHFRVPIREGEEQVIDPFHPPEFAPIEAAESIIIPPHSFVLGSSVEYIRMPPDLVGICLGRSTYARAAIITNVTPLEPGWEGNVTIEISNTNPLPVRVFVGKGIIQVLFFKADEMPSKDYVAKGGRYNMQVGVQQGRSD